MPDALAPAPFEDLRFDAPFIRLEHGAKSLHFTLGETQSSMSLEHPHALQVDYTLTLMGFLLLNPRPHHIAMIGLGGGSLAKFCHRHLAGARMTVVENNPGVIALRNEFSIPPDDERLTVLAADGAAFVRSAGLARGARQRPPLDVLLVDGFDPSGQPPQLCSQAFYDDCFAALARGGVMAVNLHADHTGHAQHLQRIARSFRGNTMQVLAAEKGNCIVFAGRERPVTLAALRRSGWACALDTPGRQQLQAEMARVGWCATALDTL